MSNDHTTGLTRLEIAAAAVVNEREVEKAQKEWEHQKVVDAQTGRILLKMDAQIEDATQVLNRYRRQIRSFGGAAAVSALGVLGGALAVSSWFSLGLTALLLNIVMFVIFGGRTIYLITDAHDTTKTDNGTRTVSAHPADVLRRLERERVDWLNLNG